MSIKRILGLGLVAALLALGVSPELQAQATARVVWIHDGLGNAISSSLEGAYRALAIVIVDPATDLPITYITDSRAAGISDSTTIRTVEATDSQQSAGIGATGDSAATAGSTGSLSSKLRLLTSQFADAVTALQLIDDDQTGTSVCAVQAGASTNATNCKASAGRLYSFLALNTTATVYYLRLYNLAASPSCNSATGFIESYPIPASATGAGVGRNFDVPRAFATGIGFCVTGGPSSTDNTNAATGVFVSLDYK